MPEMVQIDVCEGAGARCNVPQGELSVLLARAAEQNSTFVCVDVTAPTPTDWELVARSFPFHPLALEDAQRQSQRSKLDDYDTYLFLSIHAPTNADETREIDLFVGPGYLLTIDEPGGPPLDEVRARRQKSQSEQRYVPGYLLYLTLDAIVDAYFPVMDDLDEQIDAIELQVYARGAKDFELSDALLLKKKLLLLRQAVAPLRDVLNHLLRIDQPALIAPELRIFFQDVFDHTLRLVEQIDLHRDLLGSVLDAAMAQSSNKLNRVMKTMTGVSTVLMSVTLISSIYGMNFVNMPELKAHNGYYEALGAMVLVSVVLVVFFKKIKWF